MDKYPPEVVALIKALLDTERKARSVSTGVSVNFHEKLAVLTAGSLALAVSGIGLLHQKPPQEAFATHQLFVCLAISTIFLWVSLVASTLHNLTESYALHLHAESSLSEATIGFFKVVLDSEELKAIRTSEETLKIEHLLETQIKQKQQRDVMRAARLRRCELPFSIASVLCFILGYASVVAYVLLSAFCS